MKEIKTKPEGGKPRLLESAAKAPKTAMKDLWLKSKEKSVSEIKRTPFASQQGETSNAPANSAGDQMHMSHTLLLQVSDHTVNIAVYANRLHCDFFWANRFTFIDTGIDSFRISRCHLPKRIF